MDNLTERLAVCFQSVFPELEGERIQSASQASLPSWDSVHAITLLNALEEEFNIRIDFDRVAELDSFAAIHEYLRRELVTA